MPSRRVGRYLDPGGQYLGPINSRFSGGRPAKPPLLWPNRRIPRKHRAHQGPSDQMFPPFFLYPEAKPIGRFCFVQESAVVSEQRGLLALFGLGSPEVDVARGQNKHLCIYPEGSSLPSPAGPNR